MEKVMLVQGLLSQHHTRLYLTIFFILQREIYDKTGKVHLSVEEQLRRDFGHGTVHTVGSPPLVMAGLTT